MVTPRFCASGQRFSIPKPTSFRDLERVRGPVGFLIGSLTPTAARMQDFGKDPGGDPLGCEGSDHVELLSSVGVPKMTEEGEAQVCNGRGFVGATEPHRFLKDKQVPHLDIDVFAVPSVGRKGFFQLVRLNDIFTKGFLKVRDNEILRFGQHVDKSFSNE